MEKQVAWSVFARESLALSVLWTVLLVIAAGASFAITTSHNPNRTRSWLDDDLGLCDLPTEPWYLESPIIFSFGVLAFYALGCGCIMFSRDNRSSPKFAIQKRVVIGKFIRFMASISLLFAAGIWIMHSTNSNEFTAEFNASNSDVALATIILTAANLYVCGALFSYFTAQPFKSGIFGAALASIGNYLAFASLDLSARGWTIDYRFVAMAVLWVATLYVVGICLFAANVRKRGNTADLGGQ